MVVPIDFGYQKEFESIANDVGYKESKKELKTLETGSI